jgi:hypothetical protein
MRIFCTPVVTAKDIYGVAIDPVALVIDFDATALRVPPMQASEENV